MTQDDDARLRQSGDHNGVQDLAWVANAPLRQ